MRIKFLLGSKCHCVQACLLVCTQMYVLQNLRSSKWKVFLQGSRNPTGSQTTQSSKKPTIRGKIKSQFWFPSFHLNECLKCPCHMLNERKRSSTNPENKEQQRICMSVTFLWVSKLTFCVLPSSLTCWHAHWSLLRNAENNPTRGYYVTKVTIWQTHWPYGCHRKSSKNAGKNTN